MSPTLNADQRRIIFSLHYAIVTRAECLWFYTSNGPRALCADEAMRVSSSHARTVTELQGGINDTR